jgi:hypothetical protein
MTTEMLVFRQKAETLKKVNELFDLLIGKENAHLVDEISREVLSEEDYAELQKHKATIKAPPVCVPSYTYALNRFSVLSRMMILRVGFEIRVRNSKSTRRPVG